MLNHRPKLSKREVRFPNKRSDVDNLLMRDPELIREALKVFGVLVEVD